MRRRQSIVRPVSQVLLRLQRDDQRLLFDRVRTIVLEWIAGRSGRPLPDEAWHGASFELEEIGSQRAAAIAIDAPHYWAARLDDADREIPQRSWVTEVGLSGYAKGRIIFGARLVCVTRGEEVAFDRSVPGFVKQIVETEPAYIDGRRIEVAPPLIESEDDVDELVSLLTDTSRRHDIIVFALPDMSTDRSATSASAIEVHRRTYGAAHVAIIGGPASFHLTDRVGKEFSVFRQAVRTYRPGFDPNQDQPFSHPLALPARIESWAGIGPTAYEQFLISQTLARSVMSPDVEQQLPSFATVRQVAARLDTDAARREGSSEADLLVLAAEENTTLQRMMEEQKATYDGLLLTAEREREEAIQAAAQALSQVGALRRRIEVLEDRLQKTDIVSATAIPTTLTDFESWCHSHLAGAVEVHNRAVQAVKKSQYHDSTLLYRALLLLRDFYVPMKRIGGRERSLAFEREAAALGLEEGPTFSGERWGEQGDTYVLRYAGKRRLLDRHLKNGNSRDPRYCFRLYFFWDEQGEQVVVGWMPSHLESRIS